MKLYRILKGDETKAEVIEFSSGIVAVGWLTEPFQVMIWTSLDHCIGAHAQDHTLRFEEWPHKETKNATEPEFYSSQKEAALVRRPRKARRTSGENGGGPREASGK